MPNPNRIKRGQWISSFRKATNDSKGNDSKTFDAMMSSLGGSQAAGHWSIKLDTSGLKGAAYDIVEKAVRRAFNDKRTEHHPDAKFNGIEVEVKHKPKTFDSFPTDSYGLNDREDKWYLFVMGEVDGTPTNAFTAWLMRSKEIFYEVMVLRNHIPAELQSGGIGPQHSRLYINPNSSDAIAEIEAQINSISKKLAANVLNKSQGKSRVTDDPGMSLGVPVGANRIRFEIKFESLLKSYIGEIIND
jgi:hypothetical protein